MKIFLIITSLFFCLSGYSQVNPNHHYVNGYYRSNGTYVKGHYKTNPNHTNRDNYSTKPNVNPWTGQAGHIEPDNNYIPTYTPSLYKNTPSYDYSNMNSTSTYTNYSSFKFENSSSSYLAISYHDRYNRHSKKIIEEFLSQLDFDPGTVDGVFTNKTIEAIKNLLAYMQMENLDQTHYKKSNNYYN